MMNVKLNTIIAGFICGKKGFQVNNSKKLDLSAPNANVNKISLEKVIGLELQKSFGALTSNDLSDLESLRKELETTLSGSELLRSLADFIELLNETSKPTPTADIFSAGFIDITMGEFETSVPYDLIVIEGSKAYIMYATYSSKLTKGGRKQETSMKKSPRAVGMKIALENFCAEKGFIVTEFIPLIYSAKDVSILECIGLQTEEVIEHCKATMLTCPVATTPNCNGCFSKSQCDDAEAPQKNKAKVEEDTTHSNIELSDEQEAVCAITDGIHSLTAGPGSGKTTTMSRRIAMLTSMGDSVLALTFSNAATRELFKRIQAISQDGELLTEPLDMSLIQAATFNGLGDIVLSKHWTELGYSVEPSLIEDNQKKELIEKAIETIFVSDLCWLADLTGLDFKNPYYEISAFSKGGILKLLESIDCSSDKEGLEKLIPQTTSVTDADLEKIIDLTNQIKKSYIALKKNEGFYDFVDQLNSIETAIKESWDCIKFNHIIVDEFQDVNPQLLGIAKGLYESNASSLMMVGDPDQSIFKFRGATPEIMEDIEFHLPGTEVRALIGGFRCPKEVHASASEIVSTGNILHEYKGKKCFDVIHKDEFITSLSTKTPNEDVVVLARTKKELLELKRKLQLAGVDATLRVPMLVTDSLYVKAIIGLCRFFRYTTISDFAIYAKVQGIDWFSDSDKVELEAQALLTEYNSLTPKEAFEFLMTMMAVTSEDFFANHFISKLDSKNFVTADAVISFVLNYEKYNTKELVMFEDDTDGITLTTMHSAKGLEWDHVYIWSNGKGPLNPNYTEDPKAESTRLLYVAMTRTKKTLTFAVDQM